MSQPEKAPAFRRGEHVTEIPAMTPVRSSNIAAAGHDGAALWVRFVGQKGAPGKLYRYPSAGSDHHAALLAAPSPGRYHLDRIRHFHKGELIDG